MESNRDLDYLEPLSDMIILFMEDLGNMNLEEMHSTFNMQTEKRAYVRAVFAFIEGIAYMMKIQALKKCPECFNNAEIAILSEEVYALNNKNEAVSKTLKLNTTQNIIFSFKSLAKSENIEDKFDTSNNGWRLLNEALKIRHRLTHPKSVEALNVTIEEMRVMGEALGFYYTSIRNVLSQIEEKGS
jgi:hypothetical protein